MSIDQVANCKCWLMRHSHLYNFVSSTILLYMFDSVIRHILYHNFYEK